MAKYRLNITWTSETQIEVEAESKEEAEQLGYEAIEGMCIGSSINPDVDVI